MKLQQCLLLLPAFFFFTFTAPCQSTTNKPRLIIPFGHQLGIQQTFFSHDNKLLITADEMITIITDVRSGRALYYFPGTNVAISADSRYIATLLDNEVMVWNTASGLLVNKRNTNYKATRSEFHPSKELLLVETMADEEQSIDNNQTEISLWDFRENEELHVFNNNTATGDKVKGHDCGECQGSSCPVYGAWFTQRGDSIRLVYRNLIKTFALGNYTAAQRVCFTIPGQPDLPGSPQVLDQHRIAIADQNGVACFDEQGQYLCRWTTRVSKNFNLFESSSSSALCLSPANNYAASYTINRITLHDVVADKSSVYEVKGGEIRNIRFNQAGTHVLVEYLDEAPRILSTANNTLSTPQQLAANDYKGFPEYVYATKTGPDAAEAAAIFDSMDVKQPRANRKKTLWTKVGLPTLPTTSDFMHQYSVQGRAGVKSVYTNSGDIINLSKKRTITKVQSLIKLSGDISFSPDGRSMLLNTGKVISLYSIPYARLLINLKATGATSQYSPDGRWLVQYQLGGKTTLINLITGQVDSLFISLPPAMKNFISFAANGKQATISSAMGGYCTVDLLTKKIIRSVPKEYLFQADQGALYALINQEEQSVRVFNKQDSTLLYTFAPKKSNRPPGSTYRISFSSGSPAVVIWDEQSMVYFRNIHHPADTMMLTPEESETAYKVKISPNGQYLLLEGGPVPLVYNMREKDKYFSVHIGRKTKGETPDLGKMMGRMFLAMQSGNTGALSGEWHGIQFSATGDSLMICQDDSAVVYACATGNRLYGFKAGGEIKYFNFSRQFLVAYYYGSLKFYRLANRQEWFNMIPFKNGETVFLLPDGTFFGSKSATKHLGYSYDAKSLSYKQFDFNNNRPDTVLRALGNNDARYLALYDSTVAVRRKREGLQKTKVLNFDEAPVISIVNEKDLIGEVKDVKGKEQALQLKINGGKQFPDRLALFINGNPVGGTKGIRLSRRSTIIDTTVRLTLTPGNNIIEVSAFNINGAESYRHPLYIQYVPDSVSPPMIYFAGIGAATYQDLNFKDLAYAQKDILDVLDSLKGRHGSRLVVVDTLFGKEVTLARLKKLRTKFEHCRPEDIVIVYYSGHGKIDRQKTEAFFGTYDMDFNNPSDKGIAIKDFNDLMENIASRNKAVFLDACHSGELNKEAWNKKPAGNGMAKGPAADPPPSESLTNALLQPGETEPFDIVLEVFTDLYQGNGTNIIVSARGLEAAKECDALKHGVFTYALLKGMALLTADADSNDVLTIGELQQYVTGNVQHISRECQANRVQRAAARKENEYNDWALLREPGVKIERHSEIQPVVENKSLLELGKEGQDVLNTLSTVGNPIADLKRGEVPTDALENTGKALEKTGEKIASWFGKKSELQKYQKNEKKKPILLKKATNFTIQYERLDDKNLVFLISCPGLLPVILADVNGNGVMDDCTDRIYKGTANGKSIDARFLSAKTSSPYEGLSAADCKKKKSAADILVGADHYYFLIPLAEIADPGKNPLVNFIFYSSNNETAIHFPSSTGTKVFEKTEEVKLQ